MKIPRIMLIKHPIYSNLIYGKSGSGNESDRFFEQSELLLPKYHNSDICHENDSQMQLSAAVSL